MPSRPDLSVVVPAYAEAALIVPSLRAIADHVAGRPIEVIVVVAEGGDDTLELARQCAPWFEQYRVIDAGPRRGKGRDVRLGMLAARGRYRMFMDTDLATPLHHLDELSAFMAADAAVVIGVRNLWHTHRELHRRLVTSGGNLLVRMLLLPGLRDTQCGFKMFRAEVCETLFRNASIDGWGFDLEVLAAARRRGYLIETLRIDDWSDPKATALGLGGDDVGAAARQVLRDLVRLRFDAWMRPGARFGTGSDVPAMRTPPEVLLHEGHV
ncbi:MAG TPA: glycosyltransferase [Mycobacteriales bacterium]|jgi:dolichyl-phosphate beta-glucosyltransferase|nr:glycosyltransferase [Mycobacteriales bacterium]